MIKHRVGNRQDNVIIVPYFLVQKINQPFKLNLDIKDGKDNKWEHFFNTRYFNSIFLHFNQTYC